MRRKGEAMKELLAATVAAVVSSGAWAANTVCVNELCADNSVMADENGDTSSDWIELYNYGTAGASINGWYIGKKNDVTKCYTLPNYTIPAHETVLIFANSALAASVTWTNAPDKALIPANSVWKYYTGTAAPGSSWTAVSFSDTAWASGLSPLGYNDAKDNLDVATVLPYGAAASRYPAAYFRCTFQSPDPSIITGLVATVRINDGAAIYLNGTELWRYNLPSGTLAGSTLASSAADTVTWQTINLPTSALALGSNTLAVELHQAAAASTDFIFDCSLTGLVSNRKPIIHLPFGIGKDGTDNIHLLLPSGTRIQKFDGPGFEIGENKSWGLATDGNTSSSSVVYDDPTPDEPNAMSVASAWTGTLATAPTFSLVPGFYSAAQSLTMSAVAGNSIYYTLDGTDPKTSSTRLTTSSGTSVTLPATSPVTSGLSWIRTNPVEITNKVPTAGWAAPVGTVAKATVLRAIAVSGTTCSAETRGTYFIGPSFTARNLPTVSVSTETNAFFGFREGIYVPGKYYADSPEGYGSNKWGKPYANYHQDEWEHGGYFELFELGSAARSAALGLGLEMHGGGTRAIPQKALYLICRSDEYGYTSLNYRLFPDETPATYKRWLLRSSGNDWYGPDADGVSTMLKDAVFHRIVRNLDIGVEAYRPVSVYLNGEYWGIHNLRESFDKHYLATRYGLDADNMDILMHEESSTDADKVKITRIDGDKGSDEDYEAFLQNVKTNSPATAAGWTYIQSQIDVTNHADYIIAETFFANTDWPINNCDFWRAHTNETACGKYGDGRWRWMLYDLDVAGEKGVGFDMFDYLTDGKMTGVSEPGFVINELWKNSSFKSYFVNRYTQLLNTTFQPWRMASLIQSAADEIAPEIETHYRRWGRAYTQAQWAAAVKSALIDFTAQRYTNLWTHLNNNFKLGGTADLTVLNSDSTGTGGSFTVAGIVIDTSTEGVTNRAAWTGRFFKTQAVTVTAVPDSGYVFDGWAGSSVTSATRTFYLTGDKTVKARFRLASAAATSVTGYAAWQIANYTEQEILVGTAAAEDADSGYAGMSNFALYAFGMSRTDGLTDAQRIARASLSITNADGAVSVGYNRLDDSHADVAYTLKAADTLSGNWRDAVLGTDYLNVILTNSLDASTWSFLIRVPSAAAKFYKLQVSPRD
jgi:uncharacterized repeat protein (TIGR02543 family)